MPSARSSGQERHTGVAVLKMTVDDIKQAVCLAGLQWSDCSRLHWQITGGIATVHVYKSKKGFTAYVQGMAKGFRVFSTAAIIEAATEIKPSEKRAKRKRYKGAKRRKWDSIWSTGKKPCCHWCKVPFESFSDTTADHVIPLSMGGSNGYDNIVLACRDCNKKRGAVVTKEEIESVRAVRT